MSRRILRLFLLAMFLNLGNCGPASRQNIPKIRHGEGKSMKIDKNVSASNKLNDSEHTSVNSTEESTFSKFSWNSIEDMVRQVVVASHAVEHLEKMKTKLLNQFDKKTGEFATARGGYGGYGAYGFPSLEGALLSIAFLTFAVFLIDLIQQLLSRFRTGTAGVVPLVGRRRRSLVPEDEYDPLMGLTTSVLNSIESPIFKL